MHHHQDDAVKRNISRYVCFFFCARARSSVEEYVGVATILVLLLSYSSEEEVVSAARLESLLYVYSLAKKNEQF